MLVRVCVSRSGMAPSWSASQDSSASLSLTSTRPLLVSKMPFPWGSDPVVDCGVAWRSRVSGQVPSG
jgi:hypothetical protein